MESWRMVFRDSLAPLLDQQQLKALADPAADLTDELFASCTQKCSDDDAMLKELRKWLNETPRTQIKKLLLEEADRELAIREVAEML